VNRRHSYHIVGDVGCHEIRHQRITVDNFVGHRSHGGREEKKRKKGKKEEKGKDSYYN
jgi:hypothetical protein